MLKGSYTADSTNVKVDNIEHRYLIRHAITVSTKLKLHLKRRLTLKIGKTGIVFVNCYYGHTLLIAAKFKTNFTEVADTSSFSSCNEANLITEKLLAVLILSKSFSKRFWVSVTA